eukprot:CAMPEP_0172396684 /NCGR_PEP_ID=MMETSP1061-20121228/26476_1 /TAXON_ID=37318 /ORGANISM="Pseudo-nitzschia pungens, Strain cf. pungens" /LENGTH=93 /DNA_ID=CAMNT_0013128617 /DNA_START=14 /DNA_END=291 /DNA_ORIENTATION=-
MTSSKKLVSDIKTIGDSLTKEVMKDGIPSPTQCNELVSSLASIATNHKLTISILEETMIGKGLTKATKAFKRHKRTSDSADAEEWETCIEQTT